MCLSQRLSAVVWMLKTNLLGPMETFYPCTFSKTENIEISHPIVAFIHLDDDIIWFKADIFFHHTFVQLCDIIVFMLTLSALL